MYYFKMSTKRYNRDSTNRQREDKIFLNNTKNSVDNIMLSVYNQGTLKERTAAKLKGEEYGNNKRNTRRQRDLRAAKEL
jgi:hypothetical protein